MTFRRLRQAIRAGDYRGEAFKTLITQYFGDHALLCATDVGYDNLDTFINLLAPVQQIPEPILALEPEMVAYQKTPARIVLRIAGEVPLGADDVFVDIGSGLGQVVILLHLLTGVQAIGIEFEPAFCTFAQEWAAELALPSVSFTCADARKADYSLGTVFFLYTPFTGDMLEEVLEQLRQEALRRTIRIISYGPCTTRLARAEWLSHEGPDAAESIFRPVVFYSRYQEVAKEKWMTSSGMPSFTV